MMKRDKGFTILEVMIALVIMGFLMVMVSQIMRGEIRMFNSMNRQSEIEHKARTAIVHIIDEIKLHEDTFFWTDPVYYDSGVYIERENTGYPRQGLINVTPRDEVLNGNLDALMAGTTIYYNNETKELWYRNPSTAQKHLIADEIEELSILPVSRHLLRIYVKASDPSGKAAHELLTWTRIY